MLLQVQDNQRRSPEFWMDFWFGSCCRAENPFEVGGGNGRDTARDRFASVPRMAIWGMIIRIYIHPWIRLWTLQIFMLHFRVKTMFKPSKSRFFSSSKPEFSREIPRKSMQVQGSDPPVLDPTGLCGWQVQQVLGGYAGEAFRHQHGGLAVEDRTGIQGDSEERPGGCCWIYLDFQMTIWSTLW